MLSVSCRTAVKSTKVREKGFEVAVALSIKPKGPQSYEPGSASSVAKVMAIDHLDKFQPFASD
jgi:hypothetical protein